MKNKHGVDRFDLEMALNSVATIQEDLQILAEMIYDSDLIYDEDRVHTALMGLAEMVAAKTHKAEIVFEKLFELNNYCTDPEVLEMRERYGLKD